MKGYDYLIVGQGLAGSAMAIHLLQEGKEVLLIDDPGEASSSLVAAGLYNPITGRKMVKTWMADILFPYLVSFYRSMEQLLDKKFLHEIPIYRPFLTIQEQNEWMGKSVSKDYVDYIRRITTGSTYPGARDPFGGIILENSGFLDVSSYLRAVRYWFSAQGCIKTELFDYRQLQSVDGMIRYKNVDAGQIIFCEGSSVTKNPWFNRLPFRPVKGELLKVKMQSDFPVILNRGVFLVPHGAGEWIAGSTYDNRDLSWTGTAGGNRKILEGLNKLIDITFTITDHYAGVRPATADRRPILGKHPDNETINVFNGLGTKGVSLSPWCARVLTSSLIGKADLPDEVNISRYFSLY